MNAIVALLLKYIPYLIQASLSVPQLIEFVNQMKQIFTREKIWTPEEEAAFDAKVESHTDDPAWKITD
jgi:hypothetical protein